MKKTQTKERLIPIRFYVTLEKKKKLERIASRRNQSLSYYINSLTN